MSRHGVPVCSSSSNLADDQLTELDPYQPVDGVDDRGQLLTDREMCNLT
jgi:hypothetical protein